VNISKALFKLVLGICCLVSGAAVAGDPKHADIEGTYKLVGRTFTDSTIKTAPEVIGLMTFTKTYRNFNVAWKDADGKEYSYSVISKYTLTDTSYTETKLYSIANNLMGDGTKVDFASQSATVPVTFENGKVSFKFPFDPVTAVFEGDKITATAEMGFVDSWFKVR
jgi:hypothetical protein